MPEQFMRVGFLLVAFLALPKLASPQAAQQSGTLSVKGHSGQTPVLQINGASYVDIEALARLVNGSLSFQGNQIILTLSGSAAGASATPPSPSGTPNTGFSKDFLKAGIEEMSLIREWRSAMVNAVQNGYPVTDAFVANYRNQAATSLRLVSVAASTDADHSAVPLLNNEFDKMQKLSNKILAARKDMNYIAPDALQNDPLDQQILACARSLAAMAAANQFQDDGSCY
jgi:hypothetical protein